MRSTRLTETPDGNAAVELSLVTAVTSKHCFRRALTMATPVFPLAYERCQMSGFLPGSQWDGVFPYANNSNFEDGRHCGP